MTRGNSDQHDDKAQTGREAVIRARLATRAHKGTRKVLTTRASRSSQPTRRLTQLAKEGCHEL
jgi:hypothetical protein